jgi:hypothetical protein
MNRLGSPWLLAWLAGLLMGCGGDYQPASWTPPPPAAAPPAPAASARSAPRAAPPTAGTVSVRLSSGVALAQPGPEGTMMKS